MSLKIAVGGKGGVGKTTFTSLIARAIAALNKDRKVIAIDADPVANMKGPAQNPAPQAGFLP